MKDFIIHFKDGASFSTPVENIKAEAAVAFAKKKFGNATPSTVFEFNLAYNEHFDYLNDHPEEIVLFFIENPIIFRYFNWRQFKWPDEINYESMISEADLEIR